MPFLGNKQVRGRNVLVLFIAVILLSFSTWSFLRRYQVTHSSATDPPNKTIVHSTDTPDETKPGNTYNWQGSADDPKKIIIPSLGVENYIQNVGVDQRNEVAVPTNIHVAGWFVDSVRPGERGLSIIDGHLNGRFEDGVFIDLENIQQDTLYRIEFGDGSSKQFKVIDVRVVDLNEASNALFSQDPGISNQVNLITCAGTYDRNTRLYGKRVIVSSELVS